MAGGRMATAGLAIASHEWGTAVARVVVALFLLPVFLRLGIYTMPEFLEHRYGPAPRTLMATYMDLPLGTKSPISGWLPCRTDTPGRHEAFASWPPCTVGLTGGTAGLHYLWRAPTTSVRLYQKRQLEGMRQAGRYANDRNRPIETGRQVREDASHD